MKKSNVLNKKSMSFLETYLNNPSPTGYEWEGQKIWMDYLKPYVDTFITDTYGTAVGVINPDAPFKVVIEAHSDEISCKIILGKNTTLKIVNQYCFLAMFTFEV